MHVGQFSHVQQTSFGLNCSCLGCRWGWHFAAGSDLALRGETSIPLVSFARFTKLASVLGQQKHSIILLADWCISSKSTGTPQLT